MTNYSDYRSLIRDFCKFKKLSYRHLAQKTQIHTSWFSRVQSQNADFSPEQLFAVSGHLDLEPWEVDYILLLGEYSRSGHHQHKKFLLKKIRLLQKKHQKVINRIDKVCEPLSGQSRALYYQEALTAKIHMHLTIPSCQENPEELAEVLSVSREKLWSELDKLAGLGLIRIANGKVEILNSHIHLDEEDPVSFGNHINWRLEAVHHLSRREYREQDYHLSAAFSGNPEVRKFLRDRLRQLIVETQKKVNDTGGSKNHGDVCYFSLDLYSDPLKNN